MEWIYFTAYIIIMLALLIGLSYAAYRDDKRSREAKIKLLESSAILVVLLGYSLFKPRKGISDDAPKQCAQSGFVKPPGESKRQDGNDHAQDNG